MNSTPYTRHQVAIHEAGHVVVAWRLDLLPDDHPLTITPGTLSTGIRFLGKVETRDPAVSHDFDFRYGDRRPAMTEDEYQVGLGKQALYREEVEHEVMVLLAGWEALRIEDPKASSEITEHDHHQAQQQVERLAESRDEPGDWDAQLEAYWTWLETRARLLLLAHWNYVLAVAALLEERGTISTREAIVTIREVSERQLAESLAAANLSE